MHTSYLCILVCHNKYFYRLPWLQSLTATDFSQILLPIKTLKVSLSRRRRAIISTQLSDWMCKINFYLPPVCRWRMEPISRPLWGFCYELLNQIVFISRQRLIDIDLWPGHKYKRAYRRQQEVKKNLGWFIRKFSSDTWSVKTGKCKTYFTTVRTFKSARHEIEFDPIRTRTRVIRDHNIISNTVLLLNSNLGLEHDSGWLTVYLREKEMSCLLLHVRLHTDGPDQWREYQVRDL